MTSIQELAENLEHFGNVRGRLMAAIERCVHAHQSGKIYEGTFEIVLPSYFHERKIETFSLIHDDQNEAKWTIKLHCYLVGPNRHYEWTDSNLSCAIDAAAKDIDEWIVECDALIVEESPVSRP